MDNGDIRDYSGENSNPEIEKTAAAAGEGTIENESNQGLRFILEGRADHSDQFRHFILEYGQILHNLDLPQRYWFAS